MPGYFLKRKRTDAPERILPDIALKKFSTGRQRFF
jgi:hypothetical protein